LPDDCSTEYQEGDLISGTNGNGDFYRVVGTAAFVITCVFENATDSCPGRVVANITSNSDKTIEGYFVDGYAAGDEIGPGGYDLGVYVISLTK